MIILLKKACALLTTITLILRSTSATPTKQVPLASDKFGLDLYKKLNQGQNIFFSPYSITTALSMIYVGAGGQTAKEMSKSLHFDEYKLSASDVISGYKSLSTQLTGKDKNYSLDVANAAYVQKAFPLKQSYESVLTDDFHAKAFSVDFDTEADRTTEEINQFVKNATQNMIPKLLEEPLSTDTVLALINAIYFKGAWVHAFPKTFTRTDDFFSGTSKYKCQMMYYTGDLKYSTSEELKSDVLELPYLGGDVSMVIILPRDSKDLSYLTSQLSYEKLNQAISNLREDKVSVYLPKFTIKARYDLLDLLRILGFRTLSSNSADLSGISTRIGLKVSKVLHEALVIVDEKGAKASAATSVVASVKSAEITKKVFRANHPFGFLIRHIPSDTYLFFGSVVNPGTA